LRLREDKQPRLSPWLDYALRFVLRFALRPLVLRAAPRADAALRIVFFALFLFFDVIGM
jgi:hypothetical protein